MTVPPVEIFEILPPGVRRIWEAQSVQKQILHSGVLVFTVRKRLGTSAHGVDTLYNIRGRTTTGLFVA